MSYTYRDLIERSLRNFGGIARNKTMSGQQGAQGLQVLQEEIDLLNANDMFLFSRVYTVTPLVSSQQDYTVGTGQDINITRPVRIEQAWIRNNTNTPATDTPLVEFTSTEWGNITTKGVTGLIPGYFRYNPINPYGILSVFPIPQSSGYSIVTLTEVPLDSAMTLATVVSIPPGYRKMFVNILSVALASEYGMQAPPNVQQGALDAKRIISQNNFEFEQMDYDFYGENRGWWNGTTGQWQPA